MASMNISLPGPMRDWVETRISEGQYASSSDYVRDLIRKDQNNRDKFQALQDAITKGINSGTAEDFDIKQFQKRMIDNFK
ncbi:MAG: type II toxin-antitoxin system ParD family antitoxin [Gammaproteobacteria bacterium]|nr:type II toxin-antitoxin system ParD family antitoxin [Gammaproteobacteria bacterium]